MNPISHEETPFAALVGSGGQVWSSFSIHSHVTCSTLKLRNPPGVGSGSVLGEHFASW